MYFQQFFHHYLSCLFFKKILNTEYDKSFTLNTSKNSFNSNSNFFFPAISKKKTKKKTVFSCRINTNNIENKRIQRIKSTTYPSSGLRLALKENIDLQRASSLNNFIKLVSFFNSNFTLNFRPKLFKFFPIVCKLFPT